MNCLNIPRHKLSLIVAIICCFLSLAIVAPVWARGGPEGEPDGTLWFNEGASGTAQPDLTLSDRQKISIVRQLVGAALGEPFFNNELALKLVMAKSVSNDPYFDAREFTDMLLNVLSDSNKVIIVNQDLKIDIMTKMDLTLMHYENPQQTRHRGQFLGAEYLLTSRVSSRTEVNAHGKLERFYDAELRIEGVHSDKLYLKKSIVYKAGLEKKRNH